jgi:hypothetical protein
MYADSYEGVHCLHAHNVARCTPDCVCAGERCYTLIDALTVLEDSPGGTWPGVTGYTRHELPPTMIANPFRCYQIPEGWPCYIEPAPDTQAGGTNDASCPAGPIVEDVEVDATEGSNPTTEVPDESLDAAAGSPCSGCSLVDPSQAGDWQDIAATPGGNGAFGDRCYTLQEATSTMAKHGGHWPGLYDYTIEVLGPLMATDMRACYQLPAGFPCYRKVCACELCKHAIRPRAACMQRSCS